MSDIRISETGDLLLGSPMTDLDGNIILDIYDKPIRSLEYVKKYDTKNQMINVRLKTERSDFYIYPRIGTALSDLVGEPNTRETAQKGVEDIIRALTYDGLVNILNLTVKPIPVNSEEILYLINIVSDFEEPYELYVTLNLLKGVNVVDN